MSEPNRDARLLELPPGWAWAKFDDLITSLRNGISTKPTWAAGTAILRISSVRPMSLDFSDIRFLAPDMHGVEDYRLEPGDLLFTRYNGTPTFVGVCATVGTLPRPTVYPDKLIRARLIPTVSLPEYIAAAFSTGPTRDHIRRRIRTTAGQSGISGADIRSAPIPLAPCREQHRIVAAIEQHFSHLDAAVASLERVRANLKRYRASVLKAACEGRLVPTEAELARAEGGEYEPADALLRRILVERRAKWEADELAKLAAKGKQPKDDRWKAGYKEPEAPDTSELLALPEGWVWCSLGALLSQPLRNGHSARATADDHGVRTLTLTAVTTGDFSERNTKLTEADPSRVADLWLEPGDVLIERSNTPELVGTARLYRGPHHFAIIPDLLIRARLMDSVSAEYVEAVLTSSRVRRYFQSRAQGIAGSMPKIDQATVAGVVIPLPPLAEQHRIVAGLERRQTLIDALEATIDRNLKRAERLRQAILKRAFEGKLVPQDPTDEPAGVLLERIRAERQQADGRANGRARRTKAVAQLAMPLVGEGQGQGQ